MIYELLKDGCTAGYHDSLRAAVQDAGYKSEDVVRLLDRGGCIDGYRIAKIEPGRIEFARRWALTERGLKVACEIRRFATTQEAVDFFGVSETTLRRYASNGISPGGGWRFINGSVDVHNLP